jgi:hypothetical protein
VGARLPIAQDHYLTYLRDTQVLLPSCHAYVVTSGMRLSGSRAKLARAERHIKSLDGRIGALFKDNALPFQLVAERDANRSIVRWYLVNRSGVDVPGLALIFGEVLYNLRCAMDYIVTELVQASGHPVARAHQFPIYLDSAKYHKVVDPLPGSNLARGPLLNVGCGLDLFARSQPFNEPTPEASTIWLLQQMSNADKHRQAMATHPVPSGGDIEVLAQGPFRTVPPKSSDRSWDFSRRDNRVEVLSLELGPKSQVKPRIALNAQIMFVMESIDPDDQRPMACNMSNLRDSVNLVRGLIDSFADL